MNLTKIQRAFWAFVDAREEMRLHKEEGRTGMKVIPGKHSNDPILAEFHFCNVNREHDRVTRWIDENVREKYNDGTLEFMIVQLLVCRIFNEPRVLKHILPYVPERHDEFLKRCNHAEKAEGKLLRGAYLTVPGAGQSTQRYWSKVFKYLSKQLDKGPSLASLGSVAGVLMSCPRVGGFIANQVCTDLRYVSGLSWPDYETFVLAGPGTKRGLRRYLAGAKDEEKATPEEHLLNIRTYHAPAKWRETFRDINNLSNCFCEFDKYQRVIDQIARGEQPSLKRKYRNDR